MNEKIAGIGIGAMLVIAFFMMIGFAFANNDETVQATYLMGEDNEGVCDNADNCPYGGQADGFVDSDSNGVCDNAQSGSCPYEKQAGGFVDADNDGSCDKAGNCPAYKNGRGCHGSGGCPMMKEGFRGGCYH